MVVILFVWCVSMFDSVMCLFGLIFDVSIDVISFSGFDRMFVMMMLNLLFGYVLGSLYVIFVWLCLLFWCVDLIVCGLMLMLIMGFVLYFFVRIVRMFEL